MSMSDEPQSTSHDSIGASGGGGGPSLQYCSCGWTGPYKDFRMHAWQNHEENSTEPPPTKENLLHQAQQDAYQAAVAMADGDYLRAYILLSQATSQIADAGVLP